MNYAQLRERLLRLPGTTPEWLVYTVAYPADGRPVPVSYCLIAERDGRFLVYQGDERGGTSPALDEDGKTIVFPSEEAACQWIFDEIVWWRDYEASKTSSPGSAPA